MEKPIVSQGDPLDKADIYETLFVFMDEVVYEYSVNGTAENAITQDLEISLNEKTRVDDSQFAFQNQYQEGKHITDIGVYIRSTRKYFCWIEAKRLPTPKDNSRDEREYVFVDKTRFQGNGGIQRFKENKHAPGLQYSIMIGYIQDENNTTWLSKINTWITELAGIDNTGLWSNDDRLSKYSPSKCDKFTSQHKRSDGSTIILHHYWKSCKSSDIGKGEWTTC